MFKLARVGADLSGHYSLCGKSRSNYLFLKPGMKTQNGKWRCLRAALFCGFVFSGACSLHESFQIFTLIKRAMILDEIAPHLGNVELGDEHMHTLELYPYTLISFCFAYCIYLTRTNAQSSRE